MNLPSFSEWIAHWGEVRLAERIACAQNSSESLWNERNSRTVLWSYPAWELCMGHYWQESLENWHSRWQQCGGKIHAGRMIAAKWDSVWERISDTFEDGLQNPFPPYARSSCAYWSDVSQDEAIVIGAISESEFKSYMAQFPREPLKDKDGNPISKEFLQSVLIELKESIYRNGGPPPGATRAERVAHERKRKAESLERMQADYAQQNREREDKNATFRLLEEIENSLVQSPSIQDGKEWEWLCSSANKLTESKHFEGYPRWQARAWMICAELYKRSSDSANECLCLEYALTLDAKLPIKRRIKHLRANDS